MVKRLTITVLLTALLAWATNVRGAEPDVLVSKSPDGEVAIYLYPNTVCSHDVVMMVLKAAPGWDDSLLPDFHSGVITDGKDYGAFCYRTMKDEWSDKYGFWFEDGTQGLAPISRFKPEAR